MNHWTQLSIQFANQRNYLDELFRVYPIAHGGRRDIDEGIWERIEKSFKQQKNADLIKGLLELELFPIKDSYVSYLRRDEGSIERNPNTVDRLCGMLYEIGLCNMYEKCSQPKETNRQIGPLFRRWVKRGVLGVTPVSREVFLATNNNAVLDASDAQMLDFAKEHLSYEHNKGLDFIARFNNQYVIGEAKFLTDTGGHQNAQFNDAVNMVKATANAITIAILDGILYIPTNGKMYRRITEELTDCNIMSSLVLRDFLYQL